MCKIKSPQQVNKNTTTKKKLNIDLNRYIKLK